MKWKMRFCPWWLAATCVLPALVLISQFPVVRCPPVTLSVLSPSELVHQLEVESAMREANDVLKNYSCGDTVVNAIARHAVSRNVPVRIVAATVAIESSCRADAVSKAGAIGLMQINVKVHKVQNAASIESNIAAGTSILAAHIHKYGKREGLRRYFGKTPGSEESEKYADKVILFAARR